MKILINLNSALDLKKFKNFFKSCGINTETNSELKKINWLIGYNDYDIIILEDNPEANIFGIEIMENIRKKYNKGVVLLSKCNSLNRRMEAYKKEADDYLDYNILKSELMEKLKLIQKRYTKENVNNKSLVFYNFKIDLERFRVYKNGKEIALRRKEYDLFNFFLKNPEKVLNRTMILENVWDINADPFTNTVDVHVKNLRKKLGDKKGRIIKTVYGRGYEFRMKK